MEQEIRMALYGYAVLLLDEIKACKGCRVACDCDKILKDYKLVADRSICCIITSLDCGTSFDFAISLAHHRDLMSFEKLNAFADDLKLTGDFKHHQK